ncbi:MAG: zinc transporter ZupT [Bacteroidales bacterium]|jgi:ZIP family zinc transporter|nr:zinc transporter ZupT [Bacteroidales bacterium]MCB9028181.1 zinc transporter ZupT [Bacteroidales bacterium]MDD3736043.1 zinc transporter ZupT [Bacteroidales bacterium]NLD62278.1 zinc transporter ZupT [Bacteroidales bacterium]HNT92812.1 zinc transporter ZupT [Bacteroidales bacterium]
MNPDFNTILFAFLLTLFAGLSTGVGSTIAFFAKKTNTRFLTISLGFSAGVMIYVSFVEIFVKGQAVLSEAMGMRQGWWAAVIAFFAGIALIGIIDRLIPSQENPHEFKKIEGGEEEARSGRLLRMGAMTALAIGIHNFPEGLATFTAALSDPQIGIAIAVAVAIHNIPEGIAVSVPVFYATGSKKKAFRLSFLSGISEPVGAIVGYLLLMPIMTENVMGLLFCFVAGIMVFISLDELLPAAEKYGEHHLSIYGLVSGMGVMALSLLLFK